MTVRPAAAPPFDLPEGARWIGEDSRPVWRFRHLMRWPWWRMYQGRTIYAGRCFTAVVRCDSTHSADAALALRHPVGGSIDGRRERDRVSVVTEDYEVRTRREDRGKAVTWQATAFCLHCHWSCAYFDPRECAAISLAESEAQHHVDVAHLVSGAGAQTMSESAANHLRYESCAGVGVSVMRVTEHAPSVGPGRVGSDGQGECSVCGRIVAQRGGVAKRHADKRPASGGGADHE